MADTETAPTDTLIFVATTSELKSLREVAKDKGSPLLKCADPKDRPGPVYRLGRIGRHTVEAVKTDIGAFGHGGSAAQAILFQRATAATTLIQLGMAYGIDPTIQRYGDVVVSEAVFPYEQGEIVDTDDGHWKFDWSTTKLQTASPAAVKMLKDQSKRNSPGFRVLFGTMLSGNARISSPSFRRSLAAAAPDVVGGEMEAIGLMSVSADPYWVVVKGISDFGDGHCDEVHRENACRNAAAFVIDALTNDGEPIPVLRIPS